MDNLNPEEEMPEEPEWMKRIERIEEHVKIEVPPVITAMFALYGVTKFAKLIKILRSFR